MSEDIRKNPDLDSIFQRYKNVSGNVRRLKARNQKNALSSLKTGRFPIMPPEKIKDYRDIIRGKSNEDEPKSHLELEDSISKFKALYENSPLEGPIPGFNRYLRDMSPATKEYLLKGHMPEIMAFCDDRRVDPAAVAGVVEAAMRLGRVPDLGMYGFAGDEALAVKDFVADTILNLAEELEALHKLQEAEEAEQSNRDKHLKLSSDYKKLADYHKRKSDEENDKIAKFKKDGKEHSAIQAQAEMLKHKTLATHCAGLSDYHTIEARKHPKMDPQGKEEPPTHVEDDSWFTRADKVLGNVALTAASAVHPAGKLVAGIAKATGKDKLSSLINAAKGKVTDEQTIAAFAGPYMKPLRDKTGLSILKRQGLKPLARSGEGNLRISQSHFGKHADETPTPPMSENINIYDLLIEAKTKKRKPVSNVKVKEVMANVKVAPFFYQLGHKMDHSEAKVEKRKFKLNWCKELQNKALREGGSAAADAVIDHSLKNPWVRDQGYTDEASNLRRKWETAMSADAINMSPTQPEPIQMVLDKMVKLSKE